MLVVMGSARFGPNVVLGEDLCVNDQDGLMVSRGGGLEYTPLFLDLAPVLGRVLLYLKPLIWLPCKFKWVKA